VNLPNRPGGFDRPGITQPNRPGSGNRPSAGDLGDFLGLDKPVRPETLPGNVRPDGDRFPNLPGGNDRPGDRLPNRPGGNDRPGDRFPNRPGGQDRPINIGEINVGNNGIVNNRPKWTNIDRDTINHIGNRWQNQIGGIHNWGDRHPDRIDSWHNWGGGVRDHWHYHHHDWFGPSWWNNHHHNWCGWHYGYRFNNYSWNYWWTVPTFASCVNWFTWSAPSSVWAEPVYYDYGQGGNVVYQDNSVYIDGAPIATADEFAQSAMDLATVAPPASQEEAENVEWMPLGTFAVSTSDKDVEPTRSLQLAVNKEGIISGTLYNSKTDQADSIQGQVDRQTQRVAFRIGESEDVVVETGLYNLTQDEAPILVHFGPDKVENWLLVRLENPDGDEQQGDAQALLRSN
jgi:hypothetical protein